MSWRYFAPQQYTAAIESRQGADRLALQMRRELIEAILGFRSQIDFLWQFFVSVHIAIFALLFIYDEAV